MNIIIKNIIKESAAIIGRFFDNFSNTISSFFRIAILSSCKIAFKSKKYSIMRTNVDCTILANGPSLREAMNNNEIRLDGVDVFCVNSFAETYLFWTVKPKFYYLIDNEFFGPTKDRSKEQINRLNEALKKVDWNMYLCIPSHANNGGVIKEIKNKKISILRWNTSSTDGFDWFCNFVYKTRMGMPECMNVVNFAIMSGINMGYKNIYLYGIDHTFSSQLYVNDENVVCSREQHVYNEKPVIFELPETSMTRILHNMSRAFYIHEKLQKYSKRVGVRIINCTRGSFVDAYERDYSYKSITNDR